MTRFLATGSPTEVAGEEDLIIHSLMYGTVASPAAPDFWVTYAQTSLLLAEAAKRGWIAWW